MVLGLIASRWNSPMLHRVLSLSTGLPASPSVWSPGNSADPLSCGFLEEPSNTPKALNPPPQTLKIEP